MMVDLFVEIKNWLNEGMTYYFVLGGNKEYWCALNEYQHAREDVTLQVDEPLNWHWSHVDCIISQDEMRWLEVPKLLKRLGTYRGRDVTCHKEFKIEDEW